MEIDDDDVVPDRLRRLLHTGQVGRQVVLRPGHRKGLSEEAGRSRTEVLAELLAPVNRIAEAGRSLLPLQHCKAAHQVNNTSDQFEACRAGWAGGRRGGLAGARRLPQD